MMFLLIIVVGVSLPFIIIGALFVLVTRESKQLEAWKQANRKFDDYLESEKLCSKCGKDKSVKKDKEGFIEVETKGHRSCLNCNAYISGCPQCRLDLLTSDIKPTPTICGDWEDIKKEGD